MKKIKLLNKIYPILLLTLITFCFYAYSSPKTKAFTSGDIIVEVTPHKTSADLKITLPEKASLIIRYGFSEEGFSEILNIDECQTEHNKTLSDLSPSSTYYYQVIAINTAGETVVSPVKNFTTLCADDIIEIKNVNVSDIKAREAKISWDTDIESQGYVEYGTTDQYGDTSQTTEQDIHHEVTLSNLSLDTTYHFRIKATAKDDEGKTIASGTSEDKTFVTQPFDITVSDITPLSAYITLQTATPKEAWIDWGKTGGETYRSTSCYYGYVDNVWQRICPLKSANHPIGLPQIVDGMVGKFDGLKDDTEYHFTITACDNLTEQTNCKTSIDQTFRTTLHWSDYDAVPENVTWNNDAKTISLELPDPSRFMGGISVGDLSFYIGGPNFPKYYTTSSVELCPPRNVGPKNLYLHGRLYPSYTPYGYSIYFFNNDERIDCPNSSGCFMNCFDAPNIRDTWFQLRTTQQQTSPASQFEVSQDDKEGTIRIQTDTQPLLDAPILDNEGNQIPPIYLEYGTKKDKYTQKAEVKPEQNFYSAKISNVAARTYHYRIAVIAPDGQTLYSDDKTLKYGHKYLRFVNDIVGNTWDWVKGKIHK